MCQSGEKLKSPLFFHFKSVKGDYRRLRYFLKNPLGTFLSPIHVLLTCKVSEKSNERFSRNCVTDGRTNERTNERMDERDSLGLFSANRRETKKQKRQVFLRSSCPRKTHWLCEILCFWRSWEFTKVSGYIAYIIFFAMVHQDTYYTFP